MGPWSTAIVGLWRYFNTTTTETKFQASYKLDFHSKDLDPVGSYRVCHNLTRCLQCPGLHTAFSPGSCARVWLGEGDDANLDIAQFLIRNEDDFVDESESHSVSFLRPPEFYADINDI